MKFKYWLQESGINFNVTAFHCGANFNNFSTDYAGTGEGMMVLGPGVYFVTEETYARLYCKRHHPSPEAALYEAEINTTNFYCFGSSWNRNPEQSKIVSERIDEITKKMGYSDSYKLPTVSGLTYGKAPIGSIVKFLGKTKALSEFIAHGIQGSLEYLPSDPGHKIIELAVYDTSVIRSKKKTIVPKI